MSEESTDAPSEEPAPDAPPPFDVEAARARYRRTMRGRPMRIMSLLTIVIILMSWAFAAAAAYGPDVEHLPGHDLRVRRDDCIACHTGNVAQTPPMNHPAAPTCGFCHVQGTGK